MNPLDEDDEEMMGTSVDGGTVGFVILMVVVIVLALSYYFG